MPTGWEGVVIEVSLTGMELVARVVSVDFVIVGSEGGGVEMLRAKGGWREGENGGAVPVRRVAGLEVEFRIWNGTRTEGLVAFNVWNAKRSESG